MKQKKQNRKMKTKNKQEHAEVCVDQPAGTWISVNEKLPKPFQKTLVFSQKSKQIDYGYFDPLWKLWWIELDFPLGLSSSEDITHWLKVKKPRSK